MNKYRIKYYMHLLLICLLSVSFCMSILGKSVEAKGIENEIKVFYDEVSNLQKQIASTAESGYINFVHGKDNVNNLKVLAYYGEERNKLEDKLRKYKAETELNKVQLTSIERLITATSYLDLIITNLTSCLSSNEPLVQYELLATNAVSNFLVLQLLDTL
ncbi:hypothetical protein PBV87_01340 [Niameybacter massiliensis]|uniref:Uncharacterized protein n=1 Tax=Holtiella tumoricola TaxID=3018743 RepID=A0AA42IYS4_9FIRM|nr:hypothetical protein [Holtiella tumoricola]MDA3730159.1 hypothetical protein [Holtiella tumoricola]